MSIPYGPITLRGFIEFAQERGVQLVTLKAASRGLGKLLNRRYLKNPQGGMPVMIPPDMAEDEILYQETVRSWCRALGISAGRKP